MKINFFLKDFSPEGEKMQYIVGTALIYVIASVFYIPLSKKEEKGRVEQKVKQHTTEQELPNLSATPHLNNVSVRVRGRGFVAGSVRRLLRVLEESPQSVDLAIRASKHYGVPIDVLLAHWRMESFMGLSGFHGKFYALKQVQKKQRDPSEKHRWKNFASNERDLRAIARHCGYNLLTLKGSSTGALGPMQFMPSTWALVSVDASGDGKACPTNLADAMFGAALFLKGNYTRLGSWDNAMLGYAGGNVPANRAYVSRSRRIRPYFCQIMRKATGQELPCSMEPTQHLASN
ncbi:lytic transglycosylase domain-containing protein [Patescibacteria group bacterium]|nr:lytic transglycosylase domain-containing protein [Patescibacteria group bacterium]